MSQSITVNELHFIYKREETVILDTRKTSDYVKNHLSNSLSIPAKYLPDYLKIFSPEKKYYVLSEKDEHSKIITDYLAKQGLQATYIMDANTLFQESELSETC
ncbi:hypothetical protein A5844_001974 [Enterococcus sp. 10A9_DIV0425]|uniref:Rhodanese domain-containing protein n=1 Tax=Candidatus Enterococcus wittei TaxID=1987383 RepID=A0A242JY83_9ENTE|nr:rhodanese-like domain-containing protein [Enterococcus sp. 10A9_DIV0425]OTP10275.1 hypothetical protein A5844_001974 [Enterococcus sp. 10A9_DIV0425]THE10894.1 rhodanese-like domain-containing protein [Enterococcus hirae]